MPLHSLRPADPDAASRNPLLEQSESGDETEAYTRKALSPGSRRRRRPSSLAGDLREKVPFGRRKCTRVAILSGLCMILVLGLVQLVNLSVNFVALCIPNGIDNVVKNWGKPGHVGAYLSHWPTDFSRDILPIPCHSHNDYWREAPLFSALQAGCTGVEADIWRFSEELYIGHSLASLTPNRTLDSLYIKPLLKILDKMNTKPQIGQDPSKTLHGVFDVDSSRTLVLLIDFKTYGPSTWPAMYAALDPLRQKGYLTHVKNSTVINRPITVVGTGNAPFSHVTSDTHNPHHDVFFDAPLNVFSSAPSPSSATSSPTDGLRSRSTEPASQEEKPVDSQDEEAAPTDPAAYTALNSYYASTSFEEDIGHLFRGEFNDTQLERVRARFKGAQAQGLKVRYWETPYWPIGLRNHVWSVLEKEGTDYLNVDDLKAASQRNWGRWKGWWRKGMKIE